MTTCSKFRKVCAATDSIVARKNLAWFSDGVITETSGSLTEQRSVYLILSLNGVSRVAAGYRAGIKRMLRACALQNEIIRTHTRTTPPLTHPCLAQSARDRRPMRTLTGRGSKTIFLLLPRRIPGAH